MNNTKKLREIRYTLNMETMKASNIETRIVEDGKEPTTWVCIECPKSGNVVKIPEANILDR
jgi:hypothetical protein